MAVIIFFDPRLVTIPKVQANRIYMKSRLLCDFENFNFFDLEDIRTRENDVIMYSDVVGVSAAKGSATMSVCIAVIVNINV
jgi:hypothetical protein